MFSVTSFPNLRYEGVVQNMEIRAFAESPGLLIGEHGVRSRWEDTHSVNAYRDGVCAGG